MGFDQDAVSAVRLFGFARQLEKLVPPFARFVIHADGVEPGGQSRGIVFVTGGGQLAVTLGAEGGKFFYQPGFSGRKLKQAVHVAGYQSGLFLLQGVVKFPESFKLCPQADSKSISGLLFQLSPFGLPADL